MESREYRRDPRDRHADTVTAMAPLLSRAVPSPTTARSRVHCPICASTDLEYDFSIDTAPASSCTRCGLLFLNPLPDTVPERDTFRDIYEVNAAHASTRLDWLARYLEPQQRRLLLVGADPVMRQEAATRGFEILELTIDDLESGRLPPDEVGHLQAAILCCALETSGDPPGVLASITRLLEPNGALMVIAPTLDSRTARLFGTNWWEFSRRNRFYFSADTLQCLLARMHYGDPIILREESIVSVEYLRHKIASLRALRFRMMRLFLGLSPGFLQRRAFGLLHTRTVMLVRAKPATVTPRLSVVVPVYNERPTFETLIETVIRKTIPGVDIEIVIVESNSTDGTRDLVLKYRDQPRVRLILEDKPSGKGHAVRQGFAHATGDVVLIQDADLEYDIEDYDALVAPLLRFEQNFVIGSRHSKQGRLWKMREFSDAAGLAAYFNLGHVVLLTLFNALYFQKLKDPFSMFKVFRRECLYGLFFECNRFDFDLELAIKLLRKGYAARELPVNYRSRSLSAGKKVNMWRDPPTFFRALFKFRFSQLYGPWRPQ
jgi:hypothetical protein